MGDNDGVVVWGGGNKGRNEDTPGLGVACFSKESTLV